jgi:hypothetical protein
MSTAQLVDRFAEIAIAQDQAILFSETAKFNRLFRVVDEVDNELRRRGTAARLALLKLYEHNNLQVRLKAATRTLGVAPTEARLVLEAIKASKEQPYALDAGMLIRGLEDGSYRPT